MGINPGNPAFGLPPAEDSLVRQVKDLERTMRENLASVVDSFKTTVERLDAAIGQQISPAVSHVDAGNFSLSATEAELVRATISVPSGYTRALISATTGVCARNDNDGFDISMMARVDINGVTAGRLVQATVPGLAFGMVSAGAAAVLTSLSGFLYVRTLSKIAGGAFAADIGNAVNLDVSVLFLH